MAFTFYFNLRFPPIQAPQALGHSQTTTLRKKQLPIQPLHLPKLPTHPAHEKSAQYTKIGEEGREITRPVVP